jgi:hypothetical protein
MWLLSSRLTASSRAAPCDEPAAVVHGLTPPRLADRIGETPYHDSLRPPSGCAHFATERPLITSPPTIEYHHPTTCSVDRRAFGGESDYRPAAQQPNQPGGVALCRRIRGQHHPSPSIAPDQDKRRFSRRDAAEIPSDRIRGSGWREEQDDLERLHEDAAMRQADLLQLEQIAAGYPSRERFLTELTLDPPDAISDQAGVPLRDEDYLILDDPFRKGSGMEIRVCAQCGGRLHSL